jgi:hypothetical protein
MPSFGDRVTREQAQCLVVVIRQFGPTGVRGAEATSSEFDKRFRELEREMEDLHRQYRQLQTVLPKR